MAATRRAILCLGSVDAMALEEDRAKLLKLQELYCRDDPPVIPARPATTAQKKRGEGALLDLISQNGSASRIPLVYWEDLPRKCPQQGAEANWLEGQVTNFLLNPKNGF